MASSLASSSTSCWLLKWYTTGMPRRRRRRASKRRCLWLGRRQTRRARRRPRPSEGRRRVVVVDVHCSMDMGRFPFVLDFEQPHSIYSLYEHLKHRTAALNFDWRHSRLSAVPTSTPWWASRATGMSESTRWEWWWPDGTLNRPATSPWQGRCGQRSHHSRRMDPNAQFLRKGETYHWDTISLTFAPPGRYECSRPNPSDSGA